MNIKYFFTKKKTLILTVFLAIVVITTSFLVIVVNTKNKKDLISAINASWDAAKSENQPTYLTQLDELSSFTVNTVKKDGDRYIISTTVTAPDLGNQLSQLDKAKFPQNKDDVDMFLCEQIVLSKIKETSTEIYAYKINGEYHITFSNIFVDAMCGNLYKYSQNEYIELLQKYEEGVAK